MKQSATPPIYSQVAFDIASKIVSGEIKVGERFTGRSLMGSQYGVSAETIRRAMRLLGDMGIVSTQNNVGSTVLSQKRAVEYVEQYQAYSDLRALKASLREMVAKRDQLNAEINQTFSRMMDLSERFRSSDRLRTYEFQVSEGPMAGRSIGELQFRQKTSATRRCAGAKGRETASGEDKNIDLLEKNHIATAKRKRPEGRGGVRRPGGYGCRNHLEKEERA